jgi:predicted esterase
LDIVFRTTVAVLMLTMAAPAQAEPGRLAGFAYEEQVHGQTAGGEPPPLLIAFHYSGGSAAESFENYDQIAGPVRILVPLGAYPKRNGLSYFPVDYYQQTPEEQFRIARETVDSLAAFLRAAQAKYGRRPVVSGISQGGDISLLLAVYHPGLVAASVPLAAVIPDALAVTPDRARAEGPCILMMQGEADPIVDVSRTRTLAASLAAVLSLRLTTYPELAHDISPTMKSDYTAFINRALQGMEDGGRTPHGCAFPA